MKKRNLLMIVVFAVTFYSSLVFAADMKSEEPTVGMKVLDLLLVRPLGIVVSTASTAFYIATVPITYPAGVSEPAARVLVEAPWRYTGMRYLGEFNHYYYHYKDGHPITVIYEE